MRLGFGVAAGLEPAVATPLAGLCEQFGYESIWSNDVPGASGLEVLAAYAAGSESIGLGVGVLALDRHEPGGIAARIEALSLPRERLWLGVGAGVSPLPLTRMREAAGELRERLPGIRIALAAMGPRMCELAGSRYDAAFLNWMTPGAAHEARAHVEAGARSAGHAPPPVMGYIRAAIGPDAGERLLREEHRYRHVSASYEDHFARLEAPEGTVGIATPTAEDARAALANHTAYDIPVIRALTTGTLEALTTLAQSLAPAQH